MYFSSLSINDFDIYDVSKHQKQVLRKKNDPSMSYLESNQIWSNSILLDVLKVVVGQILCVFDIF